MPYMGPALFNHGHHCLSHPGACSRDSARDRRKRCQCLCQPDGHRLWVSSPTANVCLFAQEAHIKMSVATTCVVPGTTRQFSLPMRPSLQPSVLDPKFQMPQTFRQGLYGAVYKGAAGRMSIIVHASSRIWVPQWECSR